MAKTLKVNVTATEDFYDKGNSIPRKKGDEFPLRRDYAESLGKQVKIGDDIPDREPEKVEPQPKMKGNPVKDSDGEHIVEKVKPNAADKAKAAPQGKDISMDNITTEEPETQKASKKTAKVSAKKGKK